jgi:hypothetical protein
MDFGYCAPRQIPGPKAPPVIGHTLKVVQVSYRCHGKLMAQHGAVYKIKLLGRWRVMLCGANALEMVLLDHDSTICSDAC